MTHRTLLSSRNSLRWAQWIRRTFDCVLGLAALVVGVAAILYPDGTGPGSAPGVGWIFFFVIAGIWFLLRRAMNTELGALKAVSIDGDFIYVSDGTQEVSVPLNTITSVTENRWLNYHPVTVNFKTPTDFGPKVTFMPIWRVTFSLTGRQPSHPVMQQLQDAVRLTTVAARQ